MHNPRRHEIYQASAATLVTFANYKVKVVSNYSDFPGIFGSRVIMTIGNHETPLFIYDVNHSTSLHCETFFNFCLVIGNKKLRNLKLFLPEIALLFYVISNVQERKGQKYNQTDKENNQENKKKK